MIKKKGGAPRPYKPRGRGSARKAYQAEMRRRAFALRSHSPVTGEMSVDGKLETDTGMGRNLVAGYKLQRHGLVHFVKKPKGQRGV